MQRHRSKLILVCSAVLAFTSHADAEGTGGCESFAWSIELERALLTAADPVDAPSVANLGSIPEKAIAVKMAPVADVTYVAPPKGKAKDETAHAFGAALTFDGAAEPGLYQVTLSDIGWIDVIQNGAVLDAVAHTGKSDCDGVRKSVRFKIGQGPFVIQISGAPSASIRMTIRRAG